jgi:hypothetical protein
MQFILVNERMPRGSSACACCRQQLGRGYLRAMPSNRVYCGHQCYSRDREAGEWSFDRSGHLVRLTTVPTDHSGLYVDWPAPSELC